MDDRRIGIAVKDICVHYSDGVRALESATFDVPMGSITALVGVNGAGKSTLFKALMGFLPVQSGTITFLGQSVADTLKKNWVAYVPQAEEVDWSFPVLVEDVVMMGRYGQMNLLRIPSKKDRQIVREALEKVDMLALKDRQIGELSGGQKKRVFLARAIAQQAKIILLDEPFTGVDVQTEEAIISVLQELRDQGCVMLVATHNLGSVPEYCDRTIILKNTVLAYGRTALVFTQSNLERAFGGALRQFVLSGRALHEDDDTRTLTVITDDERPFVLYEKDQDT